MACRLFGTKPLPEPMLTYCHLDSWEQISVKLNLNYIIFIQEDVLESVVCQNGGHFVLASTCYCNLILGWCLMALFAGAMSWLQEIDESFGISASWHVAPIYQYIEAWKNHWCFPENTSKCLFLYLKFWLKNSLKCVANFLIGSKSTLFLITKWFWCCHATTLSKLMSNVICGARCSHIKLMGKTCVRITAFLVLHIAGSTVSKQQLTQQFQL